MATRVTDEHRAIGKALAQHFGVGADEWFVAKGGGFCVRGVEGVVTMAKARKLTGIAAEKREKRPLNWSGAAGQWNAFAALVNAVSAGTLPSK